VSLESTPSGPSATTAGTTVLGQEMTVGGKQSASEETKATEKVGKNEGMKAKVGLSSMTTDLTQQTKNAGVTSENDGIMRQRTDVKAGTDQKNTDQRNRTDPLPDLRKGPLAYLLKVPTHLKAPTGRNKDLGRETTPLDRNDLETTHQDQETTTNQDIDSLEIILDGDRTF